MSQGLIPSPRNPFPVAKKKKKRQKHNKRKSGSTKRGKRPNRPPSLNGLLSYLNNEFPECLEDKHDVLDLEEVAWQLAERLEKQRDPRLLGLAEQFVKLSPNDPGVQTILVSGYFLAGYPALALKTLRSLLSLQPDLENLERLEAQRDNLEKALREEGEDLELFTRQDEARLALSRGRFKQLEKIARDTLKLYPTDVPIRNNLSIAYFQQGRVEDAVETALGVLNDFPENLHAQANLVAYSLALGRTEEAEERAARLKESQTEGFDRWEKIAEALALVGDFEGVLEVFKRCPKGRRSGLLHHLAAVAQARRGEWKPARKHWKDALRLDPSLRLALENLENSKLPVEERHGAWPFEIWHWLPSANLKKEIGQLIDNRKRLNGLVDRTPYFPNIIPIALERAGPSGVRLAVGLALGSSSPEVQKLLVPFALGKYGSDEIRMKALFGCRQNGIIPTDTVRFWCRGEWKEVAQTDYDVTWEPTGEPYPKKVEKLASRALKTLNQGRLEEPEKLYHKCLEMLPDTPEFLNNLAVIYHSRGEAERALQTFEQVHRSHPEYSRAAITLASEAIGQGRLEEAREYLFPVQKKSRFQVSEFALFCEVQIRLCQAEGDREGVDRWKGLWEQLEARDPDCEEFRPESLQRSWGRRLMRFFG